MALSTSDLNKLLSEVSDIEKKLSYFIDDEARFCLSMRLEDISNIIEEDQLIKRQGVKNDK